MDGNTDAKMHAIRHNLCVQIIIETFHSSKWLLFVWKCKCGRTLATNLKSSCKESNRNHYYANENCDCNGRRSANVICQRDASELDFSNAIRTIKSIRLDTFALEHDKKLHSINEKQLHQQNKCQLTD